MSPVSAWGPVSYHNISKCTPNIPVNLNSTHDNFSGGVKYVTRSSKIYLMGPKMKLEFVISCKRLDSQL